MATDCRRHNPVDIRVDRADYSGGPAQARSSERRMTEIQLSTQTRDATVVVAVRGELDVVNSQQFDDYLGEASAATDRVVLDLSAGDFMDTSALAVVGRHWPRQAAAGG